MMMKKTRFFIFTALIGILSVPFTLPAKGQAAPIPDGASAAAGTPHMGNEIVISAINNEKYLPAVAFNSNHNEYLVVWHTRWGGGSLCCRDIRAQRVSARGQLLGGEFTVFEDPTKDSVQPAVAYDPINDRYLVTFIYDVFGNGSDWDLYGRLIPWDGPSVSLTAFPIITWTTSQWNPKVAYAGTAQEFLVVWSNTYAAGTPAAYVSGKRIRPDGTFPSVGAELTLSEPAVNYIDPDVTYNIARNEYLVVWDKVGSSDDIWAVRLRGDAVQLGTGPFVVAGWPDNELHPSVAACNIADQYLVTWQSDHGTGGTDYDIYGYFVTGDGALEHVFWVDGTTAPETESSVTCNREGNRYLVVYQQMWATADYGVTARLVFPNHNLGEPFVVVQPGAAANRTNPAVIGGRYRYLIVWEHQRDGTSYQDIHGKMVTPYVNFIPLILRNYH
jgi:hypothetical protein